MGIYHLRRLFGVCFGGEGCPHVNEAELQRVNNADIA